MNDLLVFLARAGKPIRPETEWMTIRINSNVTLSNIGNFVTLVATEVYWMPRDKDKRLYRQQLLNLVSANYEHAP